MNCRTTRPCLLVTFLSLGLLAGGFHVSCEASELVVVDVPSDLRSARFKSKLYTNRVVSETDGYVVGGISVGSGRSRQDAAARWSTQEGWEQVGPWSDEGAKFLPHGISFDGLTILGHLRTGAVSSFYRDASVWTDNDGVVSLDVPFSASADAGSGDGSVIAGRIYNQRDEATDVFVWSAADGVQRLDIGQQIPLSRGEMYIQGVSNDGTVLAGNKSTFPWNVFNDGALREKGWIWTSTDGVVEIESLNDDPVTHVADMTPDGAIVVGASGRELDVFDDNYETVPFVWTSDQGTQELPGWNDEWWGDPTAVTNDGTMIVGNYREKASGLVGGFIWREDRGAMELGQYLRDEHSLLLDGSVDYVLDMNGTGSHLVGEMSFEGGEHYNFLAILDQPSVLGDLNGDGLLDVLDADLIAANIRSNNPEQRFDLDANGSVDRSDLSLWIAEFANSYLGDANLDGEFNSSDLVQIFRAGQYEDAVDRNSGWADGDWNGDGDFDTSDLVAAFEQGGYELGPRPVIATVPEPASWPIACLGLFALLRRRRALAQMPTAKRTRVMDDGSGSATTDPPDKR